MTQEAVWVREYVTRDGVHVAGHWRGRHTSTTSGADSLESTGTTPLPQPSGSTNGTPSQDDKVAAGLAVLHRPRTGGGTSLRRLSTPTPDRDAADEPERCPTCGQFVDDTHTCPGPASPVPPPGDLPAASYADLKGDDRVNAMVADLETSVKSVVESGQLHRWLEAMASNGLQRWSANNRLLALLQLVQRGKSLENVHLMGFRQWRDQFNRRVNKGAKAVWILAPITRRVLEEDDDGTTRERSRVVGFKSVAVFDVSDTDGDPLPSSPIRPAQGQATPGTLTGLRDRVAQAGYHYEEAEIPDCRPSTGEGTQGYTDPASKRIVVDSRLTDAQKASTIAHELGHVHCGHVDNVAEYRHHRGRYETEAEAVAFLVCRSRGASRDQTDAFSPGYIAAWSRGDASLMHTAIGTATTASRKILEGDWPTE